VTPGTGTGKRKRRSKTRERKRSIVAVHPAAALVVEVVRVAMTAAVEAVVVAAQRAVLVKKDTRGVRRKRRRRDFLRNYLHTSFPLSRKLSKRSPERRNISPWIRVPNSCIKCPR